MNMDKNNIHVFFTINNAYSGYLGTCITSILINCDKNYFLNFYIIDGGINKLNKKRIESLKNIRDFKIEFIKVDKRKFINMPNSSQSHISNDTNYRFLVSSLKLYLDKCIFLDADLIVTGDISELWRVDVKDYYFAAVEDEAPKFPNSWIKNLPLPYDFKYVNTGVVVINLKKWRENSIEEKLFLNADKYSDKLMFPDQDILNITLYNSIRYLHHIYNAMPIQRYYDKNQRNEAFANPKVVHWAGSGKPWSHPH
ncbi:glycosyltransferase family 8 protein, partial [Campylobacter sp. RM12910]|uniref:glycosyltransferase family 8 protein n=1 Tax=Campylobacter molothri TaxID=1032242 RepID=UPI00301BB783|nr:glycosyltransferase family 8 protein [Campylobacter sp. RM12910]